ncbi:MAG: UDP-N-acetylmuramoyl-tripeptide--D-alanyl-D-alanine ligase [Erysipelotrichaceae bacterium]|nr:UDP-N-acetylmuramoyl-tripeptide--D-alanyl-D-alanine ligase [Erysipelotrichaceae bacterium]
MLIKIMIVILCLLVAVIPSKRALHMFQQNRYELYRYSHWLFRKQTFEVSGLFLFVAVFVIGHFFRGWLNTVFCAAGAAGAFWYLYESEKSKSFVKPLVYTLRVKRQIGFMAVLMLVLLFLLNKLTGNACLMGLCALLLPYLLIWPMAWLTEPLENAIKKSYENQARKILRDMPDLMSIGITGSYGKTSTKNVVGDLLSEHYRTLITPASYNTPMGITRTIRELLKPIHQVFVCEMGADHVGEITYLMDFVKPHFSIVTSIGPQHLNTFKSLENIIHEKMQAVECLPADGVAILNVDNEYIRDYEIKNSCRVVRVGIANTDADIVGKDIRYDKDGSSFTAVIRGKEYEFSTELLGENNIMNCLLAIALALEMGITAEEAQRYLKEVRPIEHRLQKKRINGYLFLDNAFNSNPVSCRQSLDVLSKMEGKRVVITPGLIDLGSEEARYNREFGAYMKDRADYVILVGELQKENILNGLKDSGYPEENISCCNTMKEAFGLVYSRFTPQDTILIENDLPDAFLK